MFPTRCDWMDNRLFYHQTECRLDLWMSYREESDIWKSSLTHSGPAQSPSSTQMMTARTLADAVHVSAGGVSEKLMLVSRPPPRRGLMKRASMNFLSPSATPQYAASGR